MLAAGKTAQVNLHKKEISNMHTPKQPNCKKMHTHAKENRAKKADMKYGCLATNNGCDDNSGRSMAAIGPYYLASIYWLLKTVASYNAAYVHALPGSNI